MSNEDKCCFCGSTDGALVKLFQGWSCIPCFRSLLMDNGTKWYAKKQRSFGSEINPKSQ